MNTTDMATLNVTLSDVLFENLNQMAKNDMTSLDEVLRKALTLYIHAHEASKTGTKLFLIDPNYEENNLEIIGL